jgi:hypothetical protein
VYTHLLLLKDIYLAWLAEHLSQESVTDVEGLSEDVSTITLEQSEQEPLIEQVSLSISEQVEVSLSISEQVEISVIELE